MTLPKVLVANRGEIAIRVFRAAKELGWTTVALYTEGDESHAHFADESVQLDSPSDYMNSEKIVECATRTFSTHIHPGYGFLSENPQLAQLAATSNVVFIGPEPEVLRVASDKMSSRELAVSLYVPVAPGRRVSSPEDALKFSQEVGLPIMIKALDGGGGRGIRICDKEDEIGDSFKRCLGESPSRQLFAEKALTGPGWKHIEIQILGDGVDVVHLWERECSVQRRFQKIIEVAPSSLSRTSVLPLVDAALRMAKALRYKGLATVEFLFNSMDDNWVFLEMNPRVQVEHTITEEIMDIDLVRQQLLLFSRPNLRLSSLRLSQSSLGNPTGYAIQLRLTAEDPISQFRLSPGKVLAGDITFPAGRGVRVDTWLSYSSEWTVGTDFDSLLAKIIVFGKTFEEATQKSKRALGEFILNSQVTTNINVLTGIVSHEDWVSANIDTLWLERNIARILELGNESRMHHDASRRTHDITRVQTSSVPHVTLQPGTMFHLTVSPTATMTDSHAQTHVLTLSSIALNTFPERLSGTLQTSMVPNGTITFDLSQSTSVAVGSSTFELADPNMPSHIGSPLTGKIVELHPALMNEGDNRVKRGEAIAVLSVMKMESVVSAPRDCVVDRIGKGIKVGVVVGEGALLAVVGEHAKSKL
ncbi:hypothetical protein VNI00_010538 [Paramarasmius palmivorus]|uniref:Pyruvate carboxylase n=1 Tax=Paramarasmius palmivorus TaxID=297713 RepID=A0AAW0CJG8_9AGAR